MSPICNATWYTIRGWEDDGYFEMSFTVSNLEYDQWSTTGEDGYWIGIGFGSLTMSGADIVLCKFLFTNSSSDSFTCNDRSGNGHTEPTIDSFDFINDNPVSTTVWYTTYNDSSVINIAVTFS